MRTLLLIILLFVSELLFGEDDKDYRKSFTNEELREKFGVSEDIDYEFTRNQRKYEKQKEIDLQILKDLMDKNGYENEDENESEGEGTDEDEDN